MSGRSGTRSAPSGSAGGFDGQAGLADPPWTGERHEPDLRPQQEGDDFPHLPLPAAQEVGDLGNGPIVRQGVPKIDKDYLEPGLAFVQVGTPLLTRRALWGRVEQFVGRPQTFWTPCHF